MRFGNPIPQQKIDGDGKTQQGNEKPARFVIKENTREKKPVIPPKGPFVKQAKNSKNHHKKYPKRRARE